ncbi:M6 family metalloprotease domain-containing protein [candidate division CSSED10-310 bacterium]|uniref:M6 family metalloprotease domain-containing protein n=1 Tax=candidate division CSSED10-310 bacterium TaxID=2855610 RepID=A0ABV6Z5C9_UNCC1
MALRILVPAVLLLFVIWGASPVLALEPPTPEQVEQYRQDGTLQQCIAAAKAIGNHRMHPIQAQRAHYKLQKLALEAQGFTDAEINSMLAPPPAWRGMPTSGDVNVFVILIEFPEYPHLEPDTTDSIHSKIFGSGSGGYPKESLHNFYERSSYNQLHIMGNTLPWYEPSYSRDSIGQSWVAVENLIKEVITYHDQQGHDFTQYDNDDDGEIDYFIVIWTGPHGAWATTWWGWMSEFWDSSFTVDGKRLSTFSWQWESHSYPNGYFSPYVVIHETGHALGLPDYYDYDYSIGPDGGVGGLDQMDGNWGDHNCFSKFVLDWLTPTTVTSGMETISLRSSSTTVDALLLMPNVETGDQFDEYFMVQNRYRDAQGNDVDYPTDGLLIWHVDARLTKSGNDFLYDNSYTSHKLLRLMEADGLEEIENGNGWADAGDFYKQGDIFGPTTTPNSARYDGTASNVMVSNISAAADTMSFTVSVGAEMRPVYRFWSDTILSHFYTINEAEKDAIIAQYSDSMWRLEGIAWYCFTARETGTLPVYRFWSAQNLSHFYTINEAEKDFIQSQYSSDWWQFQGIGWYAFPSQHTGTLPVHRFWSDTLQTHFFTINEQEKSYILATYPESMWRYEGIGWYAYP